MRAASTVLGILGLGAAACGGDPAAVTGSFGGVGVTLTHAYARTPLPDERSIVVIVLDRAADCERPQNDSLRNLPSLAIEVFAHGAGGDAIPAKAGTFQVVGAVGAGNPDGNDAVVGFDVTDATCTPRLPEVAQSGKVTLDNLSPPSGSVDVVLSTGDRFSGRFIATRCDPPPGLPAGAGGACF